MFGRITGSYKDKAKISGSKLVLSMPNAVTPCIWTLDLDASDSAVLRLDSGENGLTHLVHDHGETAEIIASFHAKGPAIRIMMQAAAAIGKYERQGAAKTGKGFGFLKRLLILLAVLFVIWFIAGFFTSGPTPNQANFEQQLQ